MYCFQAVMSVLAEHKHTFADHACLRLLRAKITVNLMDKLPRVVREQVRSMYILIMYILIMYICT